MSWFRHRSQLPPSAPKPSGNCPICDSPDQDMLDCGSTPFVTGDSRRCPETVSCWKQVCRHCGHIWTHWLDKQLPQVAEIYDGIYKGTNNESLDVNFRAAYQLELLTLAFSAAGPTSPCLDFGCGPNFPVTCLLQKLGFPAYCCDISNYYPYDGEVFFKHKLDPRRHDQFGGIISVDVIEHLGDTVNTWRHFNQILRPDGVMYHIFPTTIHYDRHHHYVTNAFHLCIFSEKSLERLCEKTGFQFCGLVPSLIPSADPTLQQIFHFKKIRTIT